MSNSYYQGQYPGVPAAEPNLQFYSAASQPSFYQGRPSLDPGSRSDVAGAIGSGGGGAGSFGGAIVVQNWWNAFTPWTGQDGEPPLLEGQLST
jgi:hypothetical protein